MKPIVLAVLGTILSAPAAEAQTRGSSPRMSCAEATSLVREQGSVVLGVGSLPAERIVRDRSFCEFTEIAELRFLPTRDNPQCPVGYRCREPTYDDWDWDKN